MSLPAPHRPLAEPFSTGASWLSRALSVSVVLHVVVALVWWQVASREQGPERELVDIELAPPPPKVEALPEEVARPPESAPETPPESAPSATPDEPGADDRFALHDAGVDAPPDATPVDAAIDARLRKPRPDAAPADASVDAEPGDGGTEDGDAMPAFHVAHTETDLYGKAKASDAGTELGGDAAIAIATSESGAGTGAGPGTGSGEGSGVAAAVEPGVGSGVAGMDNQPAVDGAPTTAGTAANLLAYFPPGHQVTALIRFDRLRNTEWAKPTERLLRPMPDYRGLFGSRDADLATRFDTLVISSPRPRDATATTLVVRSSLSRPRLRDFLTNPSTPIAWSTTKGGLYGKRSGKLFPGDTRVLLSPWRNWIVLAEPTDLPGLAAVPGNLDTIEAKAKLPPWLQTIRTIEQESGDEARGPALVLTLAGPGGRVDIPDVGVGITSVPSPQRISLAMELVKQGWLVRGNIVFASDADAIEFAQAVQEVQQRVVDSRILAGLLRRQHALAIVTGLSVARTGARVSYATSMSIADARALLAAAAATLDAYFAGLPAP
jgi:hypothetical protein